MFGIARAIVGATAWGIGASLGRELYDKFKERSPWADDPSKADLKARLDALERELEALKAQIDDAG